MVHCEAGSRITENRGLWIERISGGGLRQVWTAEGRCRAPELGCSRAAVRSRTAAAGEPQPGGAMLDCGANRRLDLAVRDRLVR
jgi:hypothetical protein